MILGTDDLQASTTALLQAQHSTAGSAPPVTEPGVDAAAQARSLHIQAAKVVTAHAASVGDNLLGVPLLAAAGLPAEAASLLQVRLLELSSIPLLERPHANHG